PDRLQGAFQVVVTTNATATLYEAGRSSNNALADDQSILLSLADRPDLQVTSVSAPAKVQAGATLSVEFTVVNRGVAETRTPRWQDRVYLSLDGKVAGAYLLGSFDNGSALAPGGDDAYRTVTGPLVVPKSVRGPAFVIVEADSFNAVDEFPLDNNNT